MEKVQAFTDKIKEFGTQIFNEWVAIVPKQIEVNLKQSILRRDPRTKELIMNFNCEVYKFTETTRLLCSYNIINFL